MLNFPSVIIPYLDYIIYGLFILLIIVGYCKGFFMQALQLLGGIIALLVAYLVAPTIASMYNFVNFNINIENMDIFNNFINNELEKIIVFFIVFAFIQFVMWLIIKPLFKFLGDLPLIGFFNKLLGSVFGFCLGIVYVLLFSALLSSPLIKDGRDIVENSVIKEIEILIPQITNEIKLMNVKWELIEKIKDENGNISSEELDYLQKWLQENDITQEKIDEILDKFQ